MKSVSLKIKYLIFLAVFIVMSYLSLIAVYHIASDKSSFLSLGIFSKGLFVQIAILLPVYFMADTLRFYYTLKAIDVNVPLKYIISLAFINIFVSNITPAATGGGFAQIYLLNKAGISIGAATAGSSIRTALPLIFFMVLTPIILIFDHNIDRLFPNRNILVYMSVMLVFAALGIIFLYKLIKKPESIVRFIGKLTSFFHRKETRRDRTSKKLDKLAVEISGFSEHLQMYLHGDKRYVFLSIGFTLLFLFTLFLFPVLLIRDLNPSASAAEIFLSQIVITAVMYFAPTPGASGVAEAAFTFLFSSYVKHSDIVSLTFTWRLFTIYIGVVIGMIIFYAKLFRKQDKLEIDKLGG